MPADIIWTLAAFFLTLLVLSYALGDNPLFQIASYLFVGVTAGYIAVLIIYQVFWAKLALPILTAPMEQKLITLVPLALGFLLIFKLFPRAAALGNIPMAFLVGVGAAVAIGGAFTGTLFGQIQGAISPFDLPDDAGSALAQLAGGVILLFGSMTSLAYFHFEAHRPGQVNLRQPKVVGLFAKFGQVFIAITLGALFAGVMAAALTALIERLHFVLDFIIHRFLVLFL
jgi:hypothetical protein